MQKIFKQSAPGMIFGAATFGLLGAMVGGRTKTKTKKNITYFLIINYNTDNETKNIVITTNDYFKVQSFVKKYKTLNPKSEFNKIDL